MEHCSLHGRIQFNLSQAKDWLLFGNGLVLQREGHDQKMVPNETCAKADFSIYRSGENSVEEFDHNSEKKRWRSFKKDKVHQLLTVRCFAMDWFHICY